MFPNSATAHVATGGLKIIGPHSRRAVASILRYGCAVAGATNRIRSHVVSSPFTLLWCLLILCIRPGYQPGGKDLSVEGS